MIDKTEELAERLMVALVGSSLHESLLQVTPSETGKLLAETAFSLAETFERRRLQHQKTVAATGVNP